MRNSVARLRRYSHVQHDRRWWLYHDQPSGCAPRGVGDPLARAIRDASPTR